MSWWQESLLLLGVALVVSVAVKAFLVQMFFVPSTSMVPELRISDRILVEKVSYWSDDVERGDVVVFRDPDSWLPTPPEPSPLQELLSLVGLYPEGGHLVKRVVGVGGDRVACCDAEDRITVNGRPVDESAYLPGRTEPSAKRFDVRVPEGSIWVMGDNRANSQDSRFHMNDSGGGAVPVDHVVGRVWAVVWPAARWEVLEQPNTRATGSAR